MVIFKYLTTLQRECNKYLFTFQSGDIQIALTVTAKCPGILFTFQSGDIQIRRWYNDKQFE